MALLTNAYEDFIDDFSSNLVYRESKKAFEPLMKEFQSDNPTIFDEAMESAITTLQYGINSNVMRFVNEYMYEKLTRVGSMLFLYIMSGSIISGAKNKFKKALSTAKTKGLKGRALKMFMGMSAGDREKSNRIEESKLAMSMLNRYEDTSLTKQAHHRKDKEYLKDLILDGTKNNKDSSLALYTQKTKTGTWAKTNEDKQLYYKATGQKDLNGQSWAKVVDKLNQYSEYAVTAENDLVSLAQTQLDLLTSQGIERVR